jgi:hypothetical protein
VNLKNIEWETVERIHMAEHNSKWQALLYEVMNFFLSHPVTGLDRPLGFQEVEAPRFLDN